VSNDDKGLNDLFGRYRTACPDVEAGPRFMPGLWERIDKRRDFWFTFQNLARAAMTASAAICLLFLLLNLLTGPQTRLLPPTYADALAADHTAEKIYYTEAVRSSNDERERAPQ